MIKLLLSFFKLLGKLIGFVPWMILVILCAIVQGLGWVVGLAVGGFLDGFKHSRGWCQAILVSFWNGLRVKASKIPADARCCDNCAKQLDVTPGGYCQFMSLCTQGGKWEKFTNSPLDMWRPRK
jgi:hypothetical protein